MQRIPKAMLQMFDMDNTSVHLSLIYLGSTVHTNMQCTSAPCSGLKVVAYEHVTGHKQPLLHKCFPSRSKMLSLCNWVLCCPLGYALALSNISVLYWSYVTYHIWQLHHSTYLLSLFSKPFQTVLFMPNEVFIHFLSFLLHFSELAST